MKSFWKNLKAVLMHPFGHHDWHEVERIDHGVGVIGETAETTTDECSLCGKRVTFTHFSLPPIEIVPDQRSEKVS